MPSSILSFRIAHRPVRLAWCVRRGDFPNFRASIRLAHLLWGGRHHPILPLDDSEDAVASAAMLASVFRVDALACVTPDDPAYAALRAHMPHLSLPASLESRLRSACSGAGGHAGLMTVETAVLALSARPNPNVVDGEYREAALMKWRDDDPLADLWLSTLGGYPMSPEGKVLEESFVRLLRGGRGEIAPDRAPSAELLFGLTPGTLAGWGLERESSANCPRTGILTGHVSDWDDIVTLWNLQASDLDVVLFDPTHADRLSSFAEEYVAAAQARAARIGDGGIAHWSRRPGERHKTPQLEVETVRYEVDLTRWAQNGPRPPVMRWGWSAVVAPLMAEGGARPALSLPLPESPFTLGHKAPAGGELMVSVAPLNTPPPLSATVDVPFVPALNQFYARVLRAGEGRVRAEREGFGVLAPPSMRVMYLDVVAPGDALRALFSAAGYHATPSRPGLIAERLIAQMGGLRGCDGFRLPGVRAVIESVSAARAFSRKEAKQHIGRQLSEYRWLRLADPRPLAGGTILPGDEGPPAFQQVLALLVERGVIRVGFEFTCPHCHLPFWRSIDEARSHMRCEFCTAPFAAAAHLGRDAWRYRRSGLFGRDDHQEGGVPVALTLAQLVLTLESQRTVLWSTALSLAPQPESGEPACEVDFAVVLHDRAGRPQVAIGEVKADSTITEGDIANVSRVAAALERVGVDAFMVFAKTGNFADDELRRCLAAQPENLSPRVIIWSQAELEPYHPLERQRLRAAGAAIGPDALPYYARVSALAAAHQNPADA